MKLWTVQRIGALTQTHFDLKLSQISVCRAPRHMGWSVQRCASKNEQIALLFEAL